MRKQGEETPPCHFTARHTPPVGREKYTIDLLISFDVLLLSREQRRGVFRDVAPLPSHHPSRPLLREKFGEHNCHNPLL